MKGLFDSQIIVLEYGSFLTWNACPSSPNSREPASGEVGLEFLVPLLIPISAEWGCMFAKILVTAV